MKDVKISRFKTAITLVLKRLRQQKDVTQANMNADILDNFGFTHNMGRNELEANFTMETLYIYCQYFNISAVDFFQMVSDVKSSEIDHYLKEKAERKKRKK